MLWYTVRHIAKLDLSRDTPDSRDRYWLIWRRAGCKWRIAKLDLSRDTPDSRDRYWLWMRSKSRWSCTAKCSR